MNEERLLMERTLAWRRKWRGRRLVRQPVFCRDRLKQARNYHGLIQADLAVPLGVRREQIALWETGRAEPDLASVYNLALLLAVPINWLLGLTDESGLDLEGDTERENTRSGADRK